jgi:cell division protease FtsH
MQKNRPDRPDVRDSIRQMGCNPWVVVVMLFAVVVLPWLWQALNTQGHSMSYTAFRYEVEQDNVESIIVQDRQVRGELHESLVTDDGVEYTLFTTNIPPFGEDDLWQLLDTHDVEVDVRPGSDMSWWQILLNLAPLVAMVGFGYILLRGMQTPGQDIMSAGKSRAKRYEGAEGRTTFEDVAGAAGPKRELQEVIAFLKDPQRFKRIGAEIPKGLLLVGPPGTGKTLLARAVAGEAEVPFFSISGSDFMEMFVGVGASRVRDLFKNAKEASPSIIFVDELDSIGRRRGAGLGGGHDEREQTLNQLLSEMDGFEPNRGVLVMAATNRPDILDPALLRPGRFDRRVVVDLPTLHEREAILELHGADKPLAEDVDLERLARGTPGFSGADLENLLNEAALIAAREDQEEIASRHIDQARDKILMGLAREAMVLTDDECRLLAYHEGGHAIVAAALPNADPIHKVTIIPRGRAMGVTQQLPERDRYIYAYDYMLDRMAVMMGGRAAEELALQTQTSGAQNDLEQATKTARSIVLNWGVSESLGRVALGDGEGQVFLGKEIAEGRSYSEETARLVDQEVRELLDTAYQRAKEALEKHRSKLDKLVELLLEEEELPGERVAALFGDEAPDDEDLRGRVQTEPVPAE